MGVDTVILMGVATSGCVLSTIRWAFDINYKPYVLADACSDPDPEVHRVLTEKVYPRQDAVLSTQAFCRLVEHA
jgi:nicotinamidase-related amidase